MEQKSLWLTVLNYLHPGLLTWHDPNHFTTHPPGLNQYMPSISNPSHGHIENTSYHTIQPPCESIRATRQWSLYVVDDFASSGSTKPISWPGNTDSTVSDMLQNQSDFRYFLGVASPSKTVPKSEVVVETAPQPIWKIFKLEIFPNFRGENKKYEWNHP